MTLIELMVVTAIIAILAGIAYPSYQQQVIRSNRSEAKAQLMQAAQEFERVRFGRDLEALVGSDQRLLEQLPAADAALCERHRIGRAIAQPNLGSCSERMVASSMGV